MIEAEVTEADVIEAKRLRREARAVFEAQRDLVRADLSAASLGQRVASRLALDGRSIVEEARGAANRHKATLAASALAMTGWFLRKPLMAFAASLKSSGTIDEPSSEPPAETPTDEEAAVAEA